MEAGIAKIKTPSRLKKLSPKTVKTKAKKPKSTSMTDTVTKPPKVTMKPTRGTAALQSVSSTMSGGMGKTARTGRRM